MRTIILAIVLAGGGTLVAGCDAMRGNQEIAIEACEGFVKSQLRSPSTYKRIEGSALLHQDDREVGVLLEYDAANAYGTPIRDRTVCNFSAPHAAEGKWPSEHDMRMEAAAAPRDGLCCTAWMRGETAAGGNDVLPRDDDIGAGMNAVGGQEMNAIRSGR